jgi:hypothetical protein
MITKFVFLIYTFLQINKFPKQTKSVRLCGIDKQKVNLSLMSINHLVFELSIFVFQFYFFVKKSEAKLLNTC